MNHTGPVGEVSTPVLSALTVKLANYMKYKQFFTKKARIEPLLCVILITILFWETASAPHYLLQPVTCQSLFRRWSLGICPSPHWVTKGDCFRSMWDVMRAAWGLLTLPNQVGRKQNICTLMVVRVCPAQYILPAQLCLLLVSCCSKDKEEKHLKSLGFCVDLCISIPLPIQDQKFLCFFFRVMINMKRVNTWLWQ